MNHPSFINITGIDGSGKTTMARLLTKQLRSEDAKTRYVWIKSLHTLAYFISRIFESRGWHRLVKNPNNTIVFRFELPNSKSAEKIWQIIEFISVLPWIIVKVNLAIFFGFTVVADRYTLDTIVSVAMRTRSPSFVASFLGKLLLKMMPKDAVIIYLDVDLHTILKRRHDIEYTADEIQGQIALYRLLAKKVGAYFIDTTMLSVEDVEKKVVDFVSNSLAGKKYACMRNEDTSKV